MNLLVEKKDCCGCTACVSICGRHALSLKEDEEGFLYPIVNRSICADCGLCKKVCPVLKYRTEPKVATPYVYAAVNKDHEQYMKSASGGLFIILANRIIENGGIVVGASYNEDFKVVHSFAETVEECEKFQSSKYVQSDTRDVFARIKRYLCDDRIILFSGTPCQVAGLKLYLSKSYKNLYTVDIVCHGVPSPRVYRDYLDFVRKGKRISSLNFKTKNPKNRITSLSIELEDGTRYQNRLVTRAWSNLQFSNCIERPSCYDCQFTHLNRPGDITLGDYWHYDKQSPEFCPQKTPSLLLVNNTKGQELFAQISLDIVCELSDIQSCLQPNLLYPTKESTKRRLFWQQYAKCSFNSILSNWANYTLKNRIIDVLKNLK